MKFAKRWPIETSDEGVVLYTQDAPSWVVMGNYTQIWNTHRKCWFVVTCAPASIKLLCRPNGAIGEQTFTDLRRAVGWKEALIAVLSDRLRLPGWQMKRNRERVLLTNNLQPMAYYFGEEE